MKKFLLVLFAAILFSSCNRDEIVNSVNPVVTNTHGYYILSEGTMAPGNAMLSFYSLASDTIYSNILKPGNLGLFPDGMIYYNGFLYILEQGTYGSAGKLYKVDTSGTVIQSISVGINPYSLTTANEKLYLTNGPAGNVTVVDINSFVPLKNIPCGSFPQEIISYNNLVYVCNISQYGGNADSTISVIDASKDSLIKNIYVKKDPSSLCLSANNYLYVGCYSDTTNIFKIDLNSLDIVQVYTESDFGFDKDLSYDASHNCIYYISKTNDIVRLNLNANDFYKLIPNPNPGYIYFYGYKYDPINQYHLICDAKDFITSGYLLKYNFYGDWIKAYNTGVAPRRIVIK